MHQGRLVQWESLCLTEPIPCYWTSLVLKAFVFPCRLYDVRVLVKYNIKGAASSVFFNVGKEVGKGTSFPVTTPSLWFYGGDKSIMTKNNAYNLYHWVMSCRSRAT